MAVKRQYCDECGEDMGVFDHRRSYDGPLSCGKPACERSARDQEAMARDEAAEDAREDDYARYR